MLENYQLKIKVQQLLEKIIAQVFIRRYQKIANR